jgi:hypothetical protein
VPRVRLLVVGCDCRVHGPRHRLVSVVKDPQVIRSKFRATATAQQLKDGAQDLLPAAFRKMVASGERVREKRSQSLTLNVARIDTRIDAALGHAGPKLHGREAQVCGWAHLDLRTECTTAVRTRTFLTCGFCGQS